MERVAEQATSPLGIPPEEHVETMRNISFSSLSVIGC